MIKCSTCGAELDASTVAKSLRSLCKGDSNKRSKEQYQHVAAAAKIRWAKYREDKKNGFIK